MNRFISTIAILLITSVASEVYAATDLGLINGTAVSDSNLTQLAASSHEYDVAFSNQVKYGNDPTVVAFFQIPNSVQLYSLSSNEKLYFSNLDTKAYLGNWPIKRTADDNQDKIAGVSASNGRDEAGTEYDMQIGTQNTPALGCLANIPLRYGDVDGDGKPELVLLLGNNDTGEGYADTRLDFVVFSLQSHSVIFSARLGREATGGSIADFDPAYKQKSNYGNLPQIIDVNGADEGAAAMRYYAKLYFGDFNDDGKPDIIAWRKRYDSRPVSDTVQGYKLTAQLLTFYELDNGIYKAQTTDEATIKGWLAAKGFTWQKGYPQTSECSGQTGKPIPETIDPLLNDPDVLK